MQQVKRLRTYVRILTATTLVLLLLLALFQAIWVYGGSETSIMNQSGLQRTRAQAIAKDVLILAYRPAAEHPSAISELQAVLPRFEQTQTALQNGDTSLQLPARVPDDITLPLSASQSDYIALDTATRLIAAHPDAPVDAVELSIVISHASMYSQEMTAVVSAWQTRIDGAFLHLFWWETGLVAAIMLVVGGKYLFVTRQILRRLSETGGA
jgi:PilJ/NarX-like methyl-accepting chemotaxis transducer